MKIYIASDIKHARRWIGLRSKAYPSITIVSSWIDFLRNGEPKDISPELITQSWKNNIKDIVLCDLLLLYVEPGDLMRGSCFEAGFAFGMSRPIIFVGDLKTIGTVECCFAGRFATMEHAIATLSLEQQMDDESLINMFETRQ